MIYHPDRDRVYFMVAPGEVPRYGFGSKPGEIELMQSGSWILVPPARVSNKARVEWLITPAHVGGQVAKFEMVRDVLSLVVKNRATPPVP